VAPRINDWGRLCTLPRQRDASAQLSKIIEIADSALAGAWRESGVGIRTGTCAGPVHFVHRGQTN